MIKFGETTIAKIRGERIPHTHTHIELLAVLHGDKGAFNPYFADIAVNTKRQYVAEWKIDLFEFTAAIELFQNKNEDKLIISIQKTLKSIQMLHERYGYHDALTTATRNRSDVMNLVKRRIQIIAGLALLSVAEDTELYIYYQNQQKKNRFAIFETDNVRQFLKDKMKFTFDAETDFNKAFTILWFHFPQDITGFDQRIKEISLEEMNL